LIDGAGGLQPNAPFIERFKRRTLTAQLAEIFDRVRGLDGRKE
jgi:hypothetical protein